VVEGGVRIAADDFELPVDPNAFPTTARTSSLVDDLLTKARNASSATAAAAPPKSVTVESTCSAAGVAVSAPSTWTAVGCCTSSRRVPGKPMRIGDALGGLGPMRVGGGLGGVGQ